MAQHLGAPASTARSFPGPSHFSRSLQSCASHANSSTSRISCRRRILVISALPTIWSRLPSAPPTSPSRRLRLGPGAPGRSVGPATYSRASRPTLLRRPPQGFSWNTEISSSSGVPRPSGFETHTTLNLRACGACTTSLAFPASWSLRASAPQFSRLWKRLPYSKFDWLWPA